MLKRPFLLFAILISSLTFGALAFIQSAWFARMAKAMVSRYLPADSGIEADFSEFSIQFFPPGISIREPVVSFNKGTLDGLPEGSKIRAERIDFNFVPLQMLTGDIRVHEAVVVRGTAQLNFSKEFLASTKAKKAPAKKRARSSDLRLALQWDELFKVRLENIALRETKIELAVAEPQLRAEVFADELRLGQWQGGQGLGYELEARLSSVKLAPRESRALWASLGLSAPKVEAWLDNGIESVETQLRLNSEGLRIQHARVRNSGIELALSGQIKSDLSQSNPQQQSLAAKLGCQLRMDLRQIAPLLGLSEKQLGGEVSLESELEGDLLRAQETLQAKVQVDAQQLRWGTWFTEKLEAKGKWQGAPSGGEIELSQLKLTSPETAREARSGIPGGGGRVEVLPFRYRWGSTAPISVGLRLDRAHLHWLLGPAARGTFGVMARLSGAVDAQLARMTDDDWSIGAQLKLRAEQFQLDNQRIGKARPLRTVLRIPSITLQGPVTVDSKAVDLDGLQIKLPKTEFKSAGSVDFEKGLNLKFSGPVVLEDVREISERPIRGKGKLTARVESVGDSFRLIFDTELQGAQYLKLNFGDFRGRIIWDDLSERLLFEDARIVQGATIVTGGGHLDLRDDAQSVLLDLNVPQGNTQDLMTVFDELIRDLTWVPRSLQGPLSAQIRVHGGLDLNELKVSSQVAGTNWEYLGERFRSVDFAAGYDRGTYFISNLIGTKRTGRMSGKISYETEKSSIAWELVTSGMSLADLDHIASLDVPMRGDLVLSSQGTGRLGGDTPGSDSTKIEMKSTVGISNFRVRGVDLPSSRLELKSSGSALSFLGSALSGQARLEGQYDFRPGVPSNLKLELREFDFSPALLLLNPSLIQDEALRGVVSGQLDLRFLSGEVERSNGRISLDRYLLSKTGASFELRNPVSALLENGNFLLGPAIIRGQKREAYLEIEGKNTRLSGSLTGQIDLSILEFLTPSIEKSAGAAGLQFSLAGSLKSPEVSGRAQVEDGSVSVRAVESPFENVSGALVLRQNVISAQNLQGTLAGGRVTSGGTVTLFVDRVPQLSLAATVRDVKLKVFPFQYIRMRGRLAVSGTSLPYLVSGDIQADSAISREKMMAAQAGARALKSARFQPKPLLAGEGDTSLFRLDIGVRADRGILVQNDLFDAEMKGVLRVVNSLATPRITGKVELVQGRMTFKDHVFQIQNAEMEFDSPTQINPRFSLLAQTEAGNTKVNLFTSGRMDSYRIELTSNPSMPEQEILSLLAMGGTSSDMGRINPGNRGMVESGSAASLALHALDVNRDLQEKTGFQLQIDDAVNSVVGNSIFQPRVDSSVTVSPKIVIRRRITRRFDVSMGSTVGIGTNVQREVNAEYRLSRGVSVLGVWNSLENVDTRNSLGSSFGLDLRLQQRFQ